MKLVGYWDDEITEKFCIELVGVPFMMNGNKIILPVNNGGVFETDGTPMHQIELGDGSNIKIFDDNGNLVFAFRNYHANATQS